MPRKGKGKAPVLATPPPTQEVEEEQSSGRLPQDKSMDTLSQQDGGEMVEIMEKLVEEVIERCLNVYIEKQLIPFSASWAVSYLTQNVEQQLLRLDEGDGSEKAIESEDSEPEPTAPEAWAQGCMPVVNFTPQSAPQQEVEIGQTPQQTAPKINQKCNVVFEIHSLPKQSQMKTSPGKPLIEKSRKVSTPCPLPRIYQKKKQNLPPRPVQGTILPPLSSLSGKTDMAIKPKSRSSSVSKRTPRSLYQHKDHQTIPKLDSLHLCQNRILIEYKILDNTYTKISSNKFRLTKLEQRPKKQKAEGKSAFMKSLTSSEDRPEMFHMENETDYWSKKWSLSRQSVEGTLHSTPVRLDEMKLAQGVDLLDPQAVDTNSLKIESPPVSTKLRMMPSDKVVPLYSVEEVTGGLPPQVTSSPALSAKLRMMPSDKAVPQYSIEEVTIGPPLQVTSLS
ncbi:uncharacterized protein C2orf81 homolog [Antennarius striatus]|uniref:uncharacterized protein C2orf81 homolog n=1 Tax=Antennarius striatus TaxID=241820 RepID=UPI0035B46DDB